MGVPTSGDFNMFGTGNTTIQGAIVQGGGNAGSLTDFDALIAASSVSKFDSTYAGNITALSQVSSSLQYRGYPASTVTTNRFDNKYLWQIQVQSGVLLNSSYSFTVSNASSFGNWYFSSNLGTSWSTGFASVNGPGAKTIYIRMGGSGGSAAGQFGTSNVGQPNINLVSTGQFVMSPNSTRIFDRTNNVSYYCNQLINRRVTNNTMCFDPATTVPSPNSGIGTTTANGSPYGRTFDMVTNGQWDIQP